MKTLDAEMLAVLEEEQTLADAAVLSEYDEGCIPLPEWRDRERAVREARRVVIAKARHGRLVARERAVRRPAESLLEGQTATR